MVAQGGRNQLVIEDRGPHHVVGIGEIHGCTSTLRTFCRGMPPKESPRHPAGPSAAAAKRPWDKDESSVGSELSRAMSVSQGEMCEKRCVDSVVAVTAEVFGFVAQWIRERTSCAVCSHELPQQRRRFSACVSGSATPQTACDTRARQSRIGHVPSSGVRVSAVIRSLESVTPRSR